MANGVKRNVNRDRLNFITFLKKYRTHLPCILYFFKRFRIGFHRRQVVRIRNSIYIFSNSCALKQRSGCGYVCLWLIPWLCTSICNVFFFLRKMFVWIGNWAKEWLRCINLSWYLSFGFKNRSPHINFALCNRSLQRSAKTYRSTSVAHECRKTNFKSVNIQEPFAAACWWIKKHVSIKGKKILSKFKWTPSEYQNDLHLSIFSSVPFEFVFVSWSFFLFLSITLKKMNFFSTWEKIIFSSTGRRIFSSFGRKWLFVTFLMKNCWKKIVIGSWKIFWTEKTE